MCLCIATIIFFLQNASAQAALQAAQALTGTQNAGTPTPTPATPITNGQDIQGGPNTVLRVIIEHMIYPISLDILHAIFQRFGKVLKIVTFTKNSKYFGNLFRSK